MPADKPPESCQRAIDDTQAWLERAVIGLNLCPFAKAVHVKGQIHISVSLANTPGVLMDDLENELKSLLSLDRQARATTILIAPYGFQEFLDFNDVLARADRLLARLALECVIQIASFHPQYQFAGTTSDDVTNFTNRAPYPTLHLLREESVDEAVQSFPHAEEIFEKNMQTLTALGLDGWQALDVGPHLGAARGKIGP